MTDCNANLKRHEIMVVSNIIIQISPLKQKSDKLKNDELLLFQKINIEDVFSTMKNLTFYITFYKIGVIPQ